MGNTVIYRNTIDKDGRLKQELIVDMVTHINKLARGYNIMTYRNTIKNGRPKQELVSDIVVHEC